MMAQPTNEKGKKKNKEKKNGKNKKGVVNIATAAAHNQWGKKYKKCKFPCKNCKSKDHYTHDFPMLREIEQYVAAKDVSTQPQVILTNPFLAQQQKKWL